MTLDFQIVTTVKTEFAQRLPSDLVTLVLEFANWANTELKLAWLEEYSRFAKLIPEFYRPDSYFNILATAHNLRERNRLIHPRLHRGSGGVPSVCCAKTKTETCGKERAGHTFVHYGCKCGDWIRVGPCNPILHNLNREEIKLPRIMRAK